MPTCTRKQPHRPPILNPCTGYSCISVSTLRFKIPSMAFKCFMGLVLLIHQIWFEHTNPQVLRPSSCSQSCFRKLWWEICPVWCLTPLEQPAGEPEGCRQSATFKLRSAIILTIAELLLFNLIIYWLLYLYFEVIYLIKIRCSIIQLINWLVG